MNNQSRIRNFQHSVYSLKLLSKTTLVKNTSHYLVIKYIIVNLQTLFERGMFNLEKIIVWIH